MRPLANSHQQNAFAAGPYTAPKHCYFYNGAAEVALVDRYAECRYFVDIGYGSVSSMFKAKDIFLTFLPVIGQVLRPNTAYR